MPFFSLNLIHLFLKYLFLLSRKSKSLNYVSQMKHLVRMYICAVCIHGCSVTLFRNSGSRSSSFPQQCQLLQSISFHSDGEFEFRTIHGRNVCMREQGGGEMDLPFRSSTFVGNLVCYVTTSPSYYGIYLIETNVNCVTEGSYS